MLHSSRASSTTLSLLCSGLVVAGLYGCERPPREPIETQATAQRNAQTPPARPDAEETVAATRVETAARRNELQTQIDAAMHEHAALEREQIRIAALLQSHQQAGEARLEQFQKELSALEAQQAADADVMDRFAERARNELESALLLDQEYQAQLGEITAQVADSNVRLQSLRSALAALPAGG